MPDWPRVLRVDEQRLFDLHCRQHAALRTWQKDRANKLTQMLCDQLASYNAHEAQALQAEQQAQWREYWLRRAAFLGKVKALEALPVVWKTVEERAELQQVTLRNPQAGNQTAPALINAVSYKSPHGRLGLAVIYSHIEHPPWGPQVQIQPYKDCKRWGAQISY